MPDDTATAEAMDPAVLRAERRLRILEELTDIAMNLARTLERHVLAAADAMDVAASPDAADAVAGHGPPPAALAFDPSVALARISRAVRLTVALEARTDEQLRALRAGLAADVETRCVADRNRETSEAAKRSQDVRETVERLVRTAAEREVEDEEALNGVLEALEERLEEDGAYQDLGRLPLRETVERLCADLQLTPDWDRWEGEGWAPEPPFSRPRNSIWHRPSRMPLRPHDGPGPAEEPAPLAHRRE